MIRENRLGHRLVAAVGVVIGVPHMALISGIVSDDRSTVEARFGRIESPTKPEIPLNAPAGSDPLSTVNGAPLWMLKDELT